MRTYFLLFTAHAWRKGEAHVAHFDTHEEALDEAKRLEFELRGKTKYSLASRVATNWVIAQSAVIPKP